jgi:dTDP-4-amino-4,6-dideoxygalactose transaminase
MGVAQMRKLEALVAEKRRLAGLYDERLRSLDAVTRPITPDGLGHVFQSYVVVLDERIDRDRVIETMREAAIETTLGTYALHAQPFFARTFGCRPGDLPESYRAYRRTLTLPLYPGLRDDQVDRVVSALTAALALAPVLRS